MEIINYPKFIFATVSLVLTIIMFIRLIIALHKECKEELERRKKTSRIDF